MDSESHEQPTMPLDVVEVVKQAIGDWHLSINGGTDITPSGVRFSLNAGVFQDDDDGWSNSWARGEKAARLREELAPLELPTEGGDFNWRKLTLDRPTGPPRAVIQAPKRGRGGYELRAAKRG